MQPVNRKVQEKQTHPHSNSCIDPLSIRGPPVPIVHNIKAEATMTTYTLPAGFTRSQVSINDTAASSYTVNADSYLLVGGSTAHMTALSLNGGVWKVTINGGVSALAEESDAVFINSPQSGTGNAKITVGAEGSIYGTYNGIISWAAADVSNSGIVEGGWDGVAFDSTGGPSNLTSSSKISVDNKAGARISGSDGIDNNSLAAITVKNAGTVETTGTVLTENGAAGGHAIFSKGLLTLTNSGEIDGDVLSRAEGSGATGNSITNSGAINGAVLLDNGKNTVTNSGGINGSLQQLYSEDRESKVSIWIRNGSGAIKNTGSISGTIVGSDDGNDTLTNSGTIYGGEDYGHNIDENNYFQVSIDLRDGNDTLTNSGQMYGDVWVGPGNDSITNSGSIYGYVDGWVGNDTITNTGSIYSTVDLGEGTNTLKNSKLITGWVLGGDGGNTITNSGTINGSVQLGAGNDSLTNSGSGVIDGDIFLGGGNDSFTGNNSAEYVHDEDGSDTYKLGGGNDVYYASSDAGTDTVDGGAGANVYDAAHISVLNLNLGTTSALGLSATTATFGAGGGSEKVTGFQTVQGSNGNDTIVGGAVAETLYGNAGNDIIAGGGGADKLWGGEGEDSFVLLNAKDSGTTRTSTDTIMDFSRGDDTIDLSNIDANSTVAGFQEFHALIANDVFSGSAGELRYVFQGGQTIVQGDTNGDKKADFQIALQGTIDLAADDIRGLSVV
jgi:hypothetical protein